MLVFANPAPISAEATSIPPTMRHTPRISKTLSCTSKIAGVRLYGISLQNEPDFSNEPGATYESCSWTPQQINTWIDSNASVLTTRLIMPESGNFNPAEAVPSFSDSTAASLAPIVAGHLYGAAPSYDLKAEGGALGTF